MAALDAGALSLPCSLTALRSTLNLTEGGEEVVVALAEFDGMGMTERGCAAWLRSVDQVAAQVRYPDLVWSGPEMQGTHARDTRRVYEELLGSAQRSVWASTFAYFDGPQAFKVLAERMDAVSLDVNLLLNIQRRKGDASAPQELVRCFADRFWGQDWPGSARPRVFYDPRSLELDGPTGVLHAKAVVVDEEALFVTSANLTEAALDRNIEVGLLVRERALALNMVQHFRGLVERGLVATLPAQ